MLRLLLLSIVLLTPDATRAAETAWVCSSPHSIYPAKYVIEGDKLKKHDPAEDMMAQSGEEYRTTYQIVLNNEYGLVGIIAEGRKYQNGIAISGRMIIIDKGTGNYLETLLVVDPQQPAKDKVERGTCIAD